MASARRERQRLNRDRGHTSLIEPLDDTPEPIRQSWFERLRGRWAVFALTRLG
jgi:hypothetical protein